MYILNVPSEYLNYQLQKKKKKKIKVKFWTKLYTTFIATEQTVTPRTFQL